MVPMMTRGFGNGCQPDSVAVAVSYRIWLLAAWSVAVLGVLHAFGTVEYVYSTRHTSDGAVYVSSVTCGPAVEVVFLGRYDPDVPGPNTAADCTRAARTRLLEAGVLIGLAVALALARNRYGRRPPTPIDVALRPLPRPSRSVSGRRSR